VPGSGALEQLLVLDVVHDVNELEKVELRPGGAGGWAELR